MIDWNMVGTGIVVLLMVMLVVWGIQRDRQYRMGRRLVARLKEGREPAACLYSWGHTFDVAPIHGKPSRRRVFVCHIDAAGIALYPLGRRAGDPLVIAPEQIRWFGRPRKYTSGTNTLWIHAEWDNQWWLVRLNLARSDMQTVIRAMKTMVTDPDLVTYYRRRRPYVHFGPVRAQPATQDVYGAWHLEEPVTLYLMPRYLVVLHGAHIQHALPLEHIQNVAAVTRLDHPDAEGLVRFTQGEQTWAFALEPHAELATALAEAAKRTLEDPVDWQRKKKKHVDDDYEDELEEDEQTSRITHITRS